MEEQRTPSILDRLFGYMPAKQRFRFQRILVWGVFWFIVCAGIALIVPNSMAERILQCVAGWFA